MSHKDDYIFDKKLVCPECHHVQDTESDVCPVCKFDFIKGAAHVLPETEPSLKNQNQLSQREYANVLTRFGALVIDSLLAFLFYIPLMIFSTRLEENEEFNGIFALISMLLAISMIVFIIWNTIVRMGKTGQSLGRKFLNIAVLTAEGNPIGVGNAALREIIGRWISGLICYIGYLNAFWDKDNQMWHDKMANCYVYYVEENFS